ncbi:YncE family protein [Patulibacter defluvii]|uniref:YncE family protein n=1 Tax=Patulibacter defluvii TaxID=3095358 RepID=UPI002A74BD04|nr:hypothetical protein [Patulibacter sp. DM4]
MPLFRRPRRLALLVASLLATAAAGPAAALAEGPAVPAQPGTREVMLVGNNWDGTADVVDTTSFKRLFRINIVPDLQQRIAEIQRDPVQLVYYALLIRNLIGEGHDQLVDDMFTSHDGRYVYVSRPSLADVVAIDLRTHRLVWRTRIDGNRSDHMAISPDGKQLLVSASTAKVVDVVDTATGRITHRIPSGDQPHESNYSADGKRIYHASIGSVFTNFDDPSQDSAKGDRVFEVIDAKTFKVLQQVHMNRKMAEFGVQGASAAVRPMAIAPGERYIYLQLSFLHGFVEYDQQEQRVTRVAALPLSAKAKTLSREQYVLDSAHHGLAINPEGTKLCVAGTMSDYAAIVARADFRTTVIPVGDKPYWATNSSDGKYCYVSVSGEDRVAIISYASEKEIASIPVGDHPQRVRVGRLRDGSGLPSSSPPAQRVAPGRLSLRARPTSDRRAPFRFRLSGELGLPLGIGAVAGCSGTVRIDLHRGGRRVARTSARLRTVGARCRYQRTLRVPARALPGRGRVALRASARFGGTPLLTPQRARTLRLTAR